MITLTVDKLNLRKVLKTLKETKDLQFNQLIDLCAVDLIEYGQSEWETKETTSKGYNRGINPQSHSRIDFVNEDVNEEYKLCVVYHLLSIKHNMRIRVKCNLSNESLIIPSVTDIFASADWYEREAYDLFGVLFEGHQDLRRILTDYGFEGYPLRKDFPLSGNVEVRYNEIEKKIVYEPVKLQQDYRHFDIQSPWEGTTYKEEEQDGNGGK